VCVCDVGLWVRIYSHAYVVVDVLWICEEIAELVYMCGLMKTREISAHDQKILASVWCVCCLDHVAFGDASVCMCDCVLI
jgi:hypothetical protein